MDVEELDTEELRAYVKLFLDADFPLSEATQRFCKQCRRELQERKINCEG